MKESIGGAWLMGLVLTFIVLFSGFIAVAVNYTKAFRVKNEIINIIERNEGYIATGENNVAEEIEDYLAGIGYNRSDLNITCPAGFKSNPKSNYCFHLQKTNETEGYYKVTTFVIIELPLMWQAFTVPVSGETKLIRNIPTGASTDN